MDINRLVQQQSQTLANQKTIPATVQRQDSTPILSSYIQANKDQLVDPDEAEFVIKRVKKQPKEAPQSQQRVVEFKKAEKPQSPVVIRSSSCQESSPKKIEGIDMKSITKVILDMLNKNKENAQEPPVNNVVVTPKVADQRYHYTDDNVSEAHRPQTREGRRDVPYFWKEEKSKPQKRFESPISGKKYLAISEHHQAFTFKGQTNLRHQLNEIDTNRSDGYSDYYEMKSINSKAQPPQIRNKKHKLGKKLRINQEKLENELMPEIEKCKAQIARLVDSNGNREDFERRKIEIEKDLRKMMYRAENKLKHLKEQERQMREIHSEFPSNYEHQRKHQYKMTRYA